MSRDFRYDLHGKRVWVAGHKGMVGSAVVRRLAGSGCQILEVGRDALDLRRQADVERWIMETRPQVVVLAAATVGGIKANDSYPARFLYDNLIMQSIIVHSAHLAGVERLLVLGSSCIYPRDCPQPMGEDALLTGPLEPTNQWYAIAKIAGIKLCDAYRREHGCDFISAMPTNLYGPGDNFGLESSHVVPALMAKMHTAKLTEAPTVAVWGSGRPLREFMHVDDLADALVFLLERYSASGHVNLGTGVEISIGGLAEMVKEIVGYKGSIIFDPSMPDGTPRKLMDSRRLSALGWSSGIGLREGLERTYAWYLENLNTGVREIHFVDQK